MINISGREYKLCFLDTCVISEIAKSWSNFGSSLLRKLPPSQYVFCYSIFTIGELLKAPQLFDSFIRFISILPCFILKNHNQIFEEEIESYPMNCSCDPILFCLKTFQSEDYYKGLFLSQQSKEVISVHERDVPKTLAAMNSWVDGYSDIRDPYSAASIEKWVELVLFKKLAIEQNEFVSHYLNNLKIGINAGQFLSWKMIALVTFYKFYLEKRKPKKSDINDILFSASFPYLDAVVLEKDLKESIRQIQKKHNFVSALELYQISDFR